MNPSAETPDLRSRIERLEARVTRLESCADFDLPDDDGANVVGVPSEDALERQLAQAWFARIGVLALAAGGAYVLFQPYANMAPALPSFAGWILAALLFVVAHVGRGAFTLVSRHVRGVAMALLFCATIRLCYFGAPPAVTPTSFLAHLLLPFAAILNLAIAWQRKSPHLMALALLMAAVTPVALGDAPTVLSGMVVLTLAVAFFGTRPNWGTLLGGGIVLVYAGYLLWAMGNPMVTRSYGWAKQPVWAPVVLLACCATLATSPLWLRVQCDSAVGGAGALANALCGYGAFLVHTYAVHHPWFTALHVAAAVILLSAAFALCSRLGSQVATFFYAMAAYAALTVAIVHVATVPKVFVWLSVESVLVVATAIWFRSRFIVVTNFVIYAVVVLGYVVLNTSESGVSIGFGLVALVSARILNWQRHRVALKTELMRNAYLASAFVVFPYALYHLAGARYAALAWVGLAGVYYALNVVIRNQKYRWMAHATLVLTAGYLLVPSHEGMTMALRLTSFIALGAAFLGVSVMSTISRR